MTPSLLDLPNELIIDILSDTTPTDIFTVSCLSKRLNRLALPIYLAAHGIPEPEQEVSLYVLDWDPYNLKVLNTNSPKLFSLYRPDTLSGLNVSTNISQVKHFRCFFQNPTTKDWTNSFQQAYNLSLAVKRTARFVERLEYVGIAEIYLVWDPYYVRSQTGSHVPIQELNEWTESFCGLLNFIVERGCTSLTVQYDASIDPAFRFRSVNPITKTFSKYVQKRRDKQPHTLHWEFHRPMYEGKADASIAANASLSRLARESNSIVTLSLHSKTLLLPPFVNWTLSLLYSHSSLTCITFAHLTFEEEIWTTLLPLIADAVSDRLTNLSFFSKCTNLRAENLVRFIARLPHLTHLSVDRIFSSRFQISGIKKLQMLTPLHLPRLQVLQAPTELASLLLDAQLPSISVKDGNLTGPLQLRSLIVYPCSQLQHLANYSESTSIINNLINQIKSQSDYEVEYSLDIQTEFSNFESITQYLQSQTSEQKAYHSVWDNITGTEVKQSAGSQIIFRDITRVVLYRLNHTPASLCLWLKLLFPHLKILVFTCRITAQPGHVSLLDAKVVEQLVEELATACPTVHTLIVADEIHKLGEY